MNGQSKLKREKAEGRGRPGGTVWLSGAVALAFVLVAAIWAFGHFGPEARVRRATLRVAEMAGKSGEESPVALGLAANRFGKELAAEAELDLEPYGTIARGRKEIVQLFAQIRSSSDVVAFDRTAVAVGRTREGEVWARVEARYRFDFSGGGGMAGNGTAELLWRKEKEGWRIARAALRPDPGSSPGGDWP